MPAFIFLFGYYARYSPSKIVFRWVIPYAVCQTVYILFAKYILKSDVALQYTTPYWLLWYMLVCIFYQLLLPLYDIAHKRGQLAALVISVLIALAVGFDDSVGYPMSLSRFFVFQPWFLLGLYCRKHDAFDRLSGLHGKRCVVLLVVSVILVGMSCIFIYQSDLLNLMLYGSASYANAGGSVWMRAALYGVALCWLLFLFVVVKPLLRRRIFCVTSIGQYTLPIFLLHGFVVKWLDCYAPGRISSVLHVAFLTCLIVLVFGNRFCKKAIDGICLCWLGKLVK